VLSEGQPGSFQAEGVFSVKAVGPMRSKLLFPVFLITIVFVLFVGCGGVSSSSSNTPVANPTPTPIAPTPTPTPVAATPSAFIFGIQAFESDTGYAGGSINSSTGQITPTGTPFNDTGLGQNIVIQLISDPQGRFLYALNLGAFGVGTTIGTPGIAEMQINRPAGTLTRIPGSPVQFSARLLGLMAIDKTGHFLYQPDSGSFDIYAIDQTSGALIKTASVTAAVSIGNFTTMSPDGRFLFNASETAVETLSIDASGNLAAVQGPVNTGGSSVGADGQLLVSADNKFLYVMNQGSVSIFGIGANGELTPVIGSPFATDDGATGFALTPDGKHLYIAFDDSSGTVDETDFVKGFTFDATASTLTPIASVNLADTATSVTIDGSGKFAYISENFQLSTYVIDPATGNLTLASKTAQPISENTQSMVVVP
jgi:6-phosphogluconolactonase (cycloisomerase 2 family)